MLSRLIQGLYALPHFPGQWSIAGLLRRRLPGGVGLFGDENGIRYFVHEASHIGHALAIGHPMEPEVEALVPSGPLGVMIDAGCNAGTFSLPFATRTKKIVAIDADADQIALMRRTVRLNGIANVELLHAAVTSRQTETETFYLADKLKDLSSRNPQMLDGRDRYSERIVPATSLARIVRQHGPVDVLKIDIEGLSGDAILSLEDMAVAVRTIIAEPSPDMSDGVPFLERAGFTVTQPLAGMNLPDHMRYTFLATRRQ
jgi:FkbM family methyltransferase